MKAELLWRPLAEEHFLEIYQMIRGEQPAAADRWFAAVLARTMSLMDFPRQGVSKPELRIEGLRRLVFGNYLLFYKTVPGTEDDPVDQVIILGIVDGRMDLRQIRSFLRS